MNKLLLFYFSGTGNTKLVTELVQEEFIQMKWYVTIVEMGQKADNSVMSNIDQYDLIAIGSPVIGHTIPRRVKQFVKQMPYSERHTKVFIFRTAGGVAEQNYAASHSMLGALRKKNYEVTYERLFAIGSNWVMKFDDEIMKQLYEATKRKVVLMCHDVVEEKERFYVLSRGLRIKMGIISSVANLLFPFLGRNMTVEHTCTCCGLCERNCPSHNIYQDNSKIKFHNNCSACLRCIYNCPQKAIQFKLFQFILLKNGYNLQKSLFQPQDPNEVTNGKVPPFTKRYLMDDNM